jgi:hypothetical protein
LGVGVGVGVGVRGRGRGRGRGRVRGRLRVRVSSSFAVVDHAIEEGRRVEGVAQVLHGAHLDRALRRQ